MTDVSDWWRTSIIDMAPGKISIRGEPIEHLIGNTGFVEMIWLMLRGDKPNQGEAALLEAALVAAVDHGPQAPSIATARMAVTCGVSLNNAMASAINMLGDVHGGAGEQAVALYQSIDERGGVGEIPASVAKYRSSEGAYLPGFGHRFHKPEDPRAPKLMQLVSDAVDNQVCDGRYLKIAVALEDFLAKEKGRPVPMNIDGATAVIFSELGFAAPLARGLFCLSRSVGILAHAWEQSQQGGRNKGPTPPEYKWTYDAREADAKKS